VIWLPGLGNRHHRATTDSMCLLVVRQYNARRQRLKTPRNSPCWCGSGRKYKKCHLGRQAESPLSLDALQGAQWGAWDEKKCLHPQASPETCDRVVAAHTVQRARVLGALVDSTNHVRTFRRVRLGSGTVLPEPRTVGWQIASTLPAFCSRHDAGTFAELETKPFDGGAEQCFLMGYRALCYELYQKQGILRAAPAVKPLLDRGRSFFDQQHIQHAQTVVNAGAQHGLNGMTALKSEMDTQLLANDFRGWSRLVVRFRGSLCVACTGGITPNRDLNGRSLQVLHDPKTSASLLLCGVTADEHGGAVVLSWRTVDRAPRLFVESMLERGGGALPGLLVQFMFAHLENTYFSDQWWRALSQGDQQHLTHLAILADPYYEEFSYECMSLVPWEVVSVQLNGAEPKTCRRG